ncbi:SUMF1/EgtB/PvdO family nonheme iron enzyme [Reichenbachiella sp. MSK19-1]|uniref:formylglycine-generating enzyme family protein n=1 Tax=Reichenbachiella sp. MSK19-1 TaxID=1897631 RepID=UPI000E6BFCE6|nr:SUMF1/EgtB/PvdO family nonheme iron enzyme [Reichenbachiella sp. MSK19-1]
MYRSLLTLLFLCMFFCASAQKNHPEAADPGCCSAKTDSYYTYNSEEGRVIYQLYDVNRASEKSVFYLGKFDPWKENRNNPFFSQTYITPPGTVPIAEGTYVDQTEVTNIDYQEFLFYVVKDSGKYADKPYLPQLETKYRSKYFLNPEFYYYPVVGIRYENARAYCDWRAKKVNRNYKEALIKDGNYYLYAGRLPTESEWKKMAGIPSKNIYIKNYKLGNDEKKHLDTEWIDNRFANPALLDLDVYFGYTHHFKIDTAEPLGIEIPAYAYSFAPTTSGIYNLYGNVKELVQGGYAIGGSFMTAFSADELFYPDDVQAYRMDVGFRCLTEIKKKY